MKIQFNDEVRDATPEELAKFEAKQAAFAAGEFGRQQAIKLKAAKDECDRRIGALVASYPKYEIDTFPKQEAEARAFAADPNAATPLIDTLCANRGIDKAELAARIVAKANLFTEFCGAVIGYRQLLEDELLATSTVAELDAIDPYAGWPA